MDDSRKGAACDGGVPLTLELALDDSSDSSDLHAAQQDSNPEPHPQISAFASSSSHAQSKSPFDSSPNGSSLNQSSKGAKSNYKSLDDTPKITIYEQEKNAEFGRLILYSVLFGALGAICFAGISLFYFSIGRRLGVLFVVFFAALGARLGSKNVNVGYTKWSAAITAGVAGSASKAVLVLMLFQMTPGFNAENLSTFLDPGKSAAIYFEQSLVNALATDGIDGQQRLDQRFAEEYEEYKLSEGEPLSFAQVFPRLFQGFDFLLLAFAMMLSFKFAANE